MVTTLDANTAAARRPRAVSASTIRMIPSGIAAANASVCDTPRRRGLTSGPACSPATALADGLGLEDPDLPVSGLVCRRAVAGVSEARALDLDALAVELRERPLRLAL